MILSSTFFNTIENTLNNYVTYIQHKQEIDYSYNDIMNLVQNGGMVIIYTYEEYNSSQQFQYNFYYLTNYYNYNNSIIFSSTVFGLGSVTYIADNPTAKLREEQIK